MSLLTAGVRGSVGTTGLAARSVKKGDPRIDFLRNCRKDVYFYFRLLGYKPTRQQKQLVEAFVEEGLPNIAVRSGKGPGKTTVSGILVPWWSLVTPDSLAVITAPTMDQCRNVWLAEAQRWISNGDKRIQYFFDFTNSGYGVAGNPMKLWGGRLRTANKPENLQGIHRENLLIYMEEASGLSHPIMQTIQDTLSGNKDAQKAGGQNRCLAVGNPNTRTCRFFDYFHSLEGNPWKALHWNAEETPNSAWFDQGRNEEIAEEFGKDSDIYRVGVLGEFPSSDPDSVISEEEFDQCFTVENYRKAMQVEDNQKQIGIDLARMGGDKNVVVVRQGGIMLSKWAKERTDPHVAIDVAGKEQDLLGWGVKDCMYVLDTVGIGDGIVGGVGSDRRMGKRVHEFRSNHTPSDPKYFDKITEAWFLFARRVRRGEVYLGSKKDRRLRMQATSRKYHITDKGKIKIESKDAYKKRMTDLGGSGLANSPDDIDAVVMAFYEKATQSMRVVTA